jgi:hypothetical protein
VLVLMAVNAGAEVVSRPVEWRAASVLTGLQRLKDEFLAESARQDVECVGAVLRTGAGEVLFTRLPRGSHPGARVDGPCPRDTTDVMEV